MLLVDYNLIHLANSQRVDNQFTISKQKELKIRMDCRYFTFKFK